MKLFKKLLASCLIFCLTALGLPTMAQARIIPTEDITSLAAAASSRDTVHEFLARADVRESMQAQGVSPEAALARVQAMSDTEVAQIAGQIEQAPAGGDILGLVFTVFIILLITDIMGLTKVFPFTRSVR